MNQRILVVEIKTIENPDLDSSQLSEITFHQDTGKIYLSSHVEQIRSAIENAVVRLGSNYRHPLHFDVQVIPAESKPENPSTRRRRRRRRRSYEER